MNAFEIIKNIIPDGIAQCQESIWDRLLIPDFNEVEPQDSITCFKSPEEWLDFELQKFAATNQQFEKLYYASKSLMREEEYNNTSFTYSFKRNYVPDYYEYKKVWQVDHYKIFDIEKSRLEIQRLFDREFLEIKEFNALKLSDRTLSRFESTTNGRYGRYSSYCEFWRKSRTIEGRQNILIEIDRWWSFDFLGAYTDNMFEFRQKTNELKACYLELYQSKNEEYLSLYNEWERRKLYHIKKQNIREEEVEGIRSGYFIKKSSSIIDLCKEVLKSSYYQFEYKNDIEFNFMADNKLLMVEYTLPSIEDLPIIKETKYLSSKREYRDMLISQSDILKLFDEAVYSITLRSIYEIFKNDSLEVIDAVNFNGWVKSINKAIGKEENTCIISIQVQRKEFMDIDLERVEPKTCFKYFKGVGSSKLYGITAIQPIMQIQKNDKRFVNSQTVDFDDSTNLAAMAWEDFEHLIRELFEKEFSSNGGEVKVTQASRDGGVDAIAFDPDPIRGGKIVIQAKRYTNTVGVSAVRDLFGTVMNEGANKGILVTTSDYGSDSYEFAKGKPITLLNGANLLYLLEKHGTRAKIDIKEARRLMNEEK
jgi:restriction system protein